MDIYSTCLNEYSTSLSLHSKKYFLCYNRANLKRWWGGGDKQQVLFTFLLLIAPESHGASRDTAVEFVLINTCLTK